MKTTIATIAFLFLAFPAHGQTVDHIQGVIDSTIEDVLERPVGDDPVNTAHDEAFDDETPAAAARYPFETQGGE